MPPPTTVHSSRMTDARRSRSSTTPPSVASTLDKPKPREAQAALEGVTVAGSPVEVTGMNALRAAPAESDSGGTGMLVETLLGALGALLVLIFVFRSFMAIVPLLMAAVAIPTTFLLIWPIANVTDVSVIVQFLVALIGLGIAIDYALLVVVRWREERRAATSRMRSLSAMR